MNNVFLKYKIIFYLSDLAHEFEILKRNASGLTVSFLFLCLNLFKEKK